MLRHLMTIKAMGISTELIQYQLREESSCLSIVAIVLIFVMGAVVAVGPDRNICQRLRGQ